MSVDDSSIPTKPEVPDEPPPALQTWPRVYTAILAYLILLIAGLYALTHSFSS